MTEKNNSKEPQSNHDNDPKLLALLAGWEEALKGLENLVVMVAIRWFGSDDKDK